MTAYNSNNFAKDRAFPPLPLEAWKETKDTLHLYLQIIGKIRLALFSCALNLIIETAS